MIHPLTAITFAAFFGAGFYVFQTKEEVAQLDRDLRDIRRQTEAEMSRTQILNAEWARLNDQERLRRMATSHLRHMQPMEPAQFQRLEDAQRRMPQAIAFTPIATGFAPRTELASAPGEALVFTGADFRPSTTPAIVPAAAPVVVAEAPHPEAARPAPEAPRADAQAAPVLVAAAAPAPAPLVIAAVPEATRAAPRVADPIRPVRAEIPVAEAPRPAPRRVRTEMASLPSVTSTGQPPRPAQPPVIHTPASPNSAIPQPAFRTAMAAPVQVSGSLIGGGMALPPPVPFGR